MQKITPIFLVLVAALLSCKKQKKIEVPILPELAAHFSFKPGTFWIYKDSISGQIDSFYVESNEYFFSQPSNDGITYRHSITMMVWGIRIDTFPTQFEGKWRLALYDSSFIMDYFQFSLGDVFIYPFRIHSYVQSDTISISNVYLKYNLYGNEYSNVAEIYHRFFGLKFNDFYISDDVGIIKMRLRMPTERIDRIWELERYSIVR